MFQTAFHWVALVGVLAVSVAAQPPNDSCSSAEMLTLQNDGTAQVTGTTIGASLDGPEFCGVSDTSPGVRECDLTLAVAVAFVHNRLANTIFLAFVRCGTSSRRPALLRSLPLLVTMAVILTPRFPSSVETPIAVI